MARKSYQRIINKRKYTFVSVKAHCIWLFPLAQAATYRNMVAIIGKRSLLVLSVSILNSANSISFCLAPFCINDCYKTQLQVSMELTQSINHVANLNTFFLGKTTISYVNFRKGFLNVNIRLDDRKTI